MFTVALAIDKIASASDNYRRLYLRIITKSYFVYNNIVIRWSEEVNSNVTKTLSHFIVLVDIHMFVKHV